MPIRRIVVLAFAWILSLFAAVAIARAQAYQVTPLPPQVYAGSDLGLRVEGQQHGALLGRLVVKVNGKWVEAHLGSASTRLSDTR